MKTGFLSSIQFWGATYFRLWECLYEGEKVSLFGILSYDTNTGQASIDETLAMIVNGAKDKIKDMFRMENYSNLYELVKQSLWFCGCCFTAFVFTRLIFRRLQLLRL